MKYKPYPKYKDSGVEWLGEIPEEWEVERFKNILIERQDTTTTGDGTLLSVSAYTGVSPRADIIGSDETLVRAETLEGYRICFNNDLVMNVMLAWSKGLGVSKHNGIVSPAYAVFFFMNHATPWYYHCLLRSDVYSAYIKAFSTGVIDSRLRLYPDVFKSLSAILPPLPTQRAIATFLDTETARIDGLIKDYEELIGLLKEKRQALISHAVTRGLSELVSTDDPEFDEWAKPVKFKDSGLEWIGEIPEGWEVVRFSHKISIQEGQVDPSDVAQKDLILIAPNHIESGTGRLLFRETASDQGAESGKYPCKKGDIVYSKIRPKLAKATIAPEDCLCSADMYPLRGGDSFYNKYLLFFLLTQKFTNWAVLESERVAMPKINRDSLSVVKLPKPMRAEQQAIASFLDKETSKIDTLVSESESAIELLKERRSALITNAVTGKINVENIA